ncbi:uncharacterized protein ColSpa_05954 [Colletotrichum spaethianum]|uniref:Uncharacterized protein n=1 Tax=Colletotrichum spaethianum TaxID=700344 RepID=A0AA37P232_9PEZI|nr:uncharacterized protein ColSpa_05954 [Colletotrichum spaethianum]GKT45773.1 hypothetical protein ColSpa_05954 [Colletotrichum spaethianum]
MYFTALAQHSSQRIIVGADPTDLQFFCAHASLSPREMKDEGLTARQSAASSLPLAAGAQAYPCHD